MKNVLVVSVVILLTAYVSRAGIRWSDGGFNAGPDKRISLDLTGIRWSDGGFNVGPDRRISFDLDETRWNAGGYNVGPDIRISLDLDGIRWNAGGYNVGPDIRISLDLGEDVPRSQIRKIVMALIADSIVIDPKTRKCVFKK